MSQTTLKGSCLCGAVKYEVTGEPRRFYHCHCSRCRKATGTGHASNLFLQPGALKWLSGEQGRPGRDLLMPLPLQRNRVSPAVGGPPGERIQCVEGAAGWPVGDGAADSGAYRS
jgi:hypothetical protein